VEQPNSLTVVLLPPFEEVPDLPGVLVYKLHHQATSNNGKTIPYSQLIDMIFASEKVITW
jgi:hypothetical protein